MRVKDIKVAKKLSVDGLIKLIKTANNFESDIMIRGTHFTIDAKSIIGMVTVLRGGIDVTIITKGDDEEEALRAIVKLLV